MIKLVPICKIILLHECFGYPNFKLSCMKLFGTNFGPSGVYVALLTLSQMKISCKRSTLTLNVVRPEMLCGNVGALGHEVHFVNCVTIVVQPLCHGSTERNLNINVENYLYFETLLSFLLRKI